MESLYSQKTKAKISINYVTTTYKCIGMHAQCYTCLKYTVHILSYTKHLNVSF